MNDVAEFRDYSIADESIFPVSLAREAALVLLGFPDLMPVHEKMATIQ